MGKRKNKLQRPDDYSRVGPIEIARFGKGVVIRNNMTEDDQNNYINDLAEEYPKIKNRIESLVKEIRELVTSYDPLQILHQSYYNMFLSLLGKPSESQHSFDDMIAVRMIDYVQSVIVSTKSRGNKYKKVDMEEWYTVYEKVYELYTNLSRYHMCHSAFLKKTDSNFNDRSNFLFVQAQELRATVRGHRYPVHEITHHFDLLYPHEDIFQELFGIGVQDLLLGFEKLQLSIMRGLDYVMQDLHTLMEKTAPLMELENVNDVSNESREVMDRFMVEIGLTELKDSFTGRFFGYDLFDVEKVTGLPKALLEELSWKIGEDESFFSEGQYAGWPLRRLPIEERPFISVEDKIYCFDLYSLFDNLYRVMQRLIFRLKPEYKNDWNEKQKQVSEQLPFTLLDKMLPGGEVYQSIYYESRSGNRGKKQWCECDGIFIFDDHLIVVEVKAGSFTYTHPSTDFGAFIKSIDNLAKKPYEQASRFIDTLKREGKVIVCDEEHRQIIELDWDKFRHVTSCSVTIDNFNEFAARLDKLSSIGIELSEFPAWNISIDDLRVYADYFESPSIFLHFLEQRIKAAQSNVLELFDELDHLGLYIEHNHYNKTAELQSGNATIWQGYREALDNYFSSQIFPDVETPNKPQQEIPKKLREIIGILDKQRKSGFTSVASAILDLSGNTKEDINGMMIRLMKRQLEAMKVMPLSMFGESKITFICNQDGISKFHQEQAKEYVLATMLKPNDSIRLALYLDYTVEGELYNVDFEFLTINDIPPERIVEFNALSDKYAKQRIFSYMKQNEVKKISRNNTCPCGSGLKYKRCCGK